MGKRLEDPSFLVPRPVLRSMGRKQTKIESIKVNKTELAIQQAEPLRDETYRRWIASLPCCVCGSVLVQCAHVRYGLAGGTAYKPSDDRTVPLCITHHAEQGPAERRFWTFYGIDPVILAGWLRNAYLRDPQDIDYALHVIEQCQPRSGI